MVSFSAVIPVRPLVLAALAAALLVASPARAAAPIVYVALGDSTAAGIGAPQGGGYPARLARRIEAADATVKLPNLGAPGATAEDLRRDQLPKAVGASPTLVTIGIGINDAMKDRPLREFARDLEVIADLVHRTKATVLVSNLPDLTLSPAAAGAPSALGRRIAQYNAAIQMIAERHGFTLVDAWQVSRAAVRERGAAEVFAADGFHPSALGYDRWADALWTAAERALAPRLQARRTTATTTR
jgi:acyl-CoA thioesterase I